MLTRALADAVGDGTAVDAEYEYAEMLKLATLRWSAPPATVWAHLSVDELAADELGDAEPLAAEDAVLCARPKAAAASSGRRRSMALVRSAQRGRRGRSARHSAPRHRARQFRESS